MTFTPADLGSAIALNVGVTLLYVAAAVGAGMALMFALVGIRKAIYWARDMIAAPEPFGAHPEDTDPTIYDEVDDRDDAWFREYRDAYDSAHDDFSYAEKHAFARGVADNARARGWI